MKITYVPVTDALLQEVAENMAPKDVAEVWHSTGESPLQAVRSSAALSVESWVVCLGDKAVAVFGIGTCADYPQFGIPWLLGTPEVARHARELVRKGRAWIAQWESHYTALFNFISAEHYAAQRWMMWLGFVPIKAHVLRGRDFIEFTRMSPCPE